MRLSKRDHRGDGRSLRDALVRLSARGVSAKPPGRKQSALSWPAFLVYNASAMKTRRKTTRRRAYPILQQIVQHLPCWTLEKLANKNRIDARSFSATCHVVALMIAHLAHTSSLNETCDVCAMHEKKFRHVRNVTPPHRNTLSNANRTRPAAMAEELFWTVKAALETNSVTVNGKAFNPRGRPKGLLHRFKRAIYAIDSTTIQLVLNCIDWAKHRRRKAASRTRSSSSPATRRGKSTRSPCAGSSRSWS